MTTQALPTISYAGFDAAEALGAYRAVLTDQLNHHILAALKHSEGRAVFRLVGGQLVLDDIYAAAGGSRAAEVDDVVTPLTLTPARGVTVTLDPVELFGAALLDIEHDPDGAVLVVDVGTLAAIYRHGRNPNTFSQRSNSRPDH